MDQQEWSRRWKLVLWTAGIVSAAALLIVVLCGYLFGWKWTGLPKQTFWDWQELLIVPVVLAIGGYLLNSSQNQATERAADRRAQDDALQGYLDHMSELLSPKKDQPSLYDVASLYDAAQTSSHKKSTLKSLRSLAQARTATVLARLDRGHKGHVLYFLYVSELLTRDRPILDLRNIDLNGSDLRSVHLSRTSLKLAHLS